MVTTAVNDALVTLFFGEVWYFGILIFIVLALAITKMNKYAGVIVYPMVMGMEVMYYERIGETPDLAWGMISLLLLALMVTIYLVWEKSKK